jgi:hypothetical protein
MPKIVVCILMWVYLIFMRIYVYILYSQDPFFDKINGVHVNMAFKYLESAGIVIVMFYVVYFFMITYQALVTIRALKKSYRYAMGITIFVMAFSSSIMLQNG